MKHTTKLLPLLLACLLCLCACSTTATTPTTATTASTAAATTPTTATTLPPAVASAPVGDTGESVTLTGDGLSADITYTLDQLMALPDAPLEAAYSTVNNWPTAKTYAAQGVKVSAILQAAGVWDSAQTVTFAADDGYATTLTRSQLMETKRYYFPDVAQNSDAGGQPVEAMLAYATAEDATDPATATDAGGLMLLFGQATVQEHSSPSFVEKVSTITVSNVPAQQWAAATVFPAQGAIAAGETVKLQHESLGLVKIYYTLDGSDPTPQSTMYNPSTYQPDLNAPIPITQDTTIKTLVCGYGKEDSKIATFTFSAQ